MRLPWGMSRTDLPTKARPRSRTSVRSRTGSRRTDRSLARRLRLPLVLVVVALVLAYGADRFLAAAVERRVSAMVGCRLDGAELTTSLPGPFVTPRLLTGDLGTVTVQGAVDTAAGPTHLQLSLRDVHARPFSDEPVDVAGAEATVTMPYDQLPGTEAGQQRFENAGDQLAVIRPGVVLGGDLRVLMDLALAGEELVLTPTTVEVAGQQLPVDLVAPILAGRDPELAGQLEPRQVALPGLPSGLVPDNVAAGPDGLTLHASLDTNELASATAGDCPA
ncbi:hypothetical protein Strop_1419 [Salinispora tropica CNB-440]|uniref:DUF2993 domain-containing protein n=1 Tax=Salinispora tropica (strain ATCC BAA-916 / DSM 44818 / JCM 13857 / NBRC 105044 / CNB-440) TaxID=369723 RepID=A4X4T6_SALTO|nr:hypothetical protein Strop_1419 [Salinispora tropica CNB-440]